MITPDETGQYPPRHDRHRIWFWAAIVGSLILAFGTGIGIGSAGSGGITKAVPRPAVTVTQTPDVPVPSTSVPDTSGSLTGPLGTAFTDTTQDQSGNDVSYDVTAARVADPATGSDQYTTPDLGNRFVGVEFKITGDTGYSTDDANSDAVVIGDNGQTYTADFNSISEGTDFNSGNFGVRAGQTQTGWVTFQVPKGVKVTSIQWQPGTGQPAEWDL